MAKIIDCVPRKRVDSLGDSEKRSGDGSKRKEINRWIQGEPSWETRKGSLVNPWFVARQG
jgi:hypothetical protein